MYSLSQLTQEIRELVDYKIKKKEVINPDWVTQEIMGRHQEIEGDDTDFYLCVGRESIRSQVRSQINRFKLSPEKAIHIDRQMVLPGYERLQEFYLVGNGESQIAIPLEKMTSTQRKAKASELRAMGTGCNQHADEIDRYDEEHPNLKAA